MGVLYSMAYPKRKLTKQLQSILTQYSDEGQILKELIKHADDAGGSEIKFLYDEHIYGVDSLFKKELEEFQGPALYACYDVDSNEKDWTSELIHENIEKDDVIKVGQFGIGLKSIFHMTDLPGFLSGENIAFIDPHEIYFLEGKNRTPSFGWSMKKEKDDIQNFGDQFSPFKIDLFGSNEETFEKGHYDKTLFRFPLRQKDSKSEISQLVYDEDKVNSLFDSFKLDAHMVLLFLKNLEKIELYTRKKNAENPELQFRVQIHEKCLIEVRAERRKFLAKIKEEAWKFEPVENTFLITVDTTTFQNSQVTKKEVSSWAVSQYYSGGKLSTQLKELQDSDKVKRLPWVGVAYPLESEPSCCHGISTTNEVQSIQGHVFCFLPLPQPMDGKSMTGLPVHVNGCFALDQKGHNLKRPIAEQNVENLTDNDLKWNVYLIQEALPQAWGNLIESLLKRSQENKSGDILTELDPKIYMALPNSNTTDSTWNDVAKVIYRQLRDVKMFYTSNNQWVQWSEAVVFNLLEQKGVDSVTQSVVLKVTNGAHRGTVAVPEHVMQGFKKYCSTNIKEIDANLVRECLLQIQDSVDFTRNEYLFLLQYIGSKDLSTKGLRLLPLADGTMTTFEITPQDDRIVYIPNDEFRQSLLPHLEHLFVEPGLTEEMKKILEEIEARGTSRLKHLSKNDVTSLLPKVLPEEWQGEDYVDWDYAQVGHPTEEWLEEVWTFLKKHYPKDLSAFHELHLIPKIDRGKMQLFKIHTKRPLILYEWNGRTLPKLVETALEKVGGYILPYLISYVKGHKKILQYLKPSLNAKTLLDIFSSIQKDGASSFMYSFENLSSDEKRVIREFLIKNDDGKQLKYAKKILKKLPLFETLDGSGGHSRFVSLDMVKIAAPCGCRLDIKTRQQLLDITDGIVFQLAAILDIKPISKLDFLKEHRLEDIIDGQFYNRDEVESVIKDILQNLEPNFTCLLSELQGIPFLTNGTQDGELYKVSELYDPEDSLLCNLLDEESCFPSDVWRSPSLLCHLKSMGLKQKHDLAVEDLMKLAERIQQKGNVTQQATAFMKLLKENPELLNTFVGSDKFCERLKTIRWVICEEKRPEIYPTSLEWKGTQSTLATPEEVILENHAKLVGSVKFVVPSEMSSEDVADNFGWSTIRSSDPVFEHFSRVLKAYSPDEKHRYLHMVEALYEYFQSLNISDLKKRFKSGSLEKWIWNGNGFVSKHCIVFDKPPMDLSPHVFSIPAEMMKYQGLFFDLGVLEECNLIDALWKIKLHHESEERTPTEVTRDLHICIAILNSIKADVKGKKLAVTNNIIIPIHTPDPAILKLIPVDECVYCDKDWLQGNFDMSSLEKTALHKDIPISIAETFQIPGWTPHNKDFEDMPVSRFLHGAPLTSRLKDILKDDQGGFGVYEEIILNADSAGSTEVKILYDERKNEDAMTCLINEDMKECQGPALWVYYNTTFTTEDFESLVKLSGATKKELPDKNGNFRLGFNAVYNLTDVPSVLSGHRYFVLDPHTKHLGKVIRDKTNLGIRMHLKKANLKTFKNQFKPFHRIFGCDFDPEEINYEGTLFRFPLRTRRQAADSDISDIHYDRTQVAELLEMLEKGADSLLLFTQNVLKVSVYHLASDAITGDDMVSLFTIEKSGGKVLEKLKNLQDVPRLQETQLGPSRELLQQSRTLKAVQQEMQNTRPKPENATSSMILEVKVSLSAQAENMLSISAQEKHSTWLICSSMGRKECLDLANKDKGLSPVGGAAIQIEKKGAFYKPCRRIASPCSLFCFLPLPIECSMSMYLNGFFAITSSRRSLVEKTVNDKDDTMAKWNSALVKDAVCSAYLQILVELSKMCDPSDYVYHMLWPTDGTSRLWQDFFQTFYSVAATSSTLKLFSDEDNWSCMNKVYFLDQTLQNTQDVGSVALRVFRTFEKEKKVVEMPLDLYNRFAKNQCEHIVKERTKSTLVFFEEIVFEHIYEMQPNDRDILIEYALLQNDPGLDELLAAHQCIPVCPNGVMLQNPRQLIDPRGKAAILYSQEDGRFPYEPPKGCGYVDFSNQLASELGRVGMVQNDIPWDDVIERCKSVKTLSLQDATKRSENILNYIQWKLDQAVDDPQETHARADIVDITFLPIEKQPSNYPFPWKGNDYEEGRLISPNEAFLHDNMSLIGSIHPLVNISGFPDSKVPRFLGLLTKEISIEDVLKQLDVITEWASDTQDGRVTKHTGVTLQRTCGDIYSYLESQCWGSYDFSTLSQERIILANEHFMTPERCTLKLGFESSTPYLYEINTSQRLAFGNLLGAAGVQERFLPKTFIEVLCELHDKKGGQSLDSKELKLAINILNQLAADLPESKLRNLSEIVNTYGVLYIPDAHGVMRNGREVCYNPSDLSWLERNCNMTSTHTDISSDLAEKLGINTIRGDLTKQYSTRIPSQQNEGFINYLSNLLKAYPCDFGILKDLLQHADDAGATEVHFVIDARYHNAEKVMSDEWKQLQGPALLVYYNKPFTQNDLEGIHSLGGGSKGNDPTKTGQYGIGFNCVYHLTDVPTFMTTIEGTRTVLCAFDPHCQYVPGVDQDAPGQMFEDRLREDFPDTFAPFLHDYFDIEHGTVFRFPLRTTQMAQYSKLVTKNNTKLTQNPEVLKEMLMEFKSEMSHCLLFLSNVKTIQISEIEEGNLKHIYGVKSALSPVEEDIQTTFCRHEKNQSKRVKDGEIKVVEIPYKDASYRLEVETSDEKKESWLITKCIGFMGNEGINDDVKEALDRGDLGLLPRGAIATKFNCQEKSSRLFCFLPLPVKTSLPVHVNGHFALNSDNRRDLWADEGTGYRTTWNTLLFTNTLARAYASLLLYMKKYILSGNLQDQLPWYYNLFPSTDQTSLYMKDFVTSLYQTTSWHEEDQAVLPVIRGTQKEMEWFPPCGTHNQRAFFDNLQEQEIQDFETVKDILQATGFNLLNAPMAVYDKFKESGVHVETVSPKAVLKFFLGVNGNTSSCNLTNLPKHVYDTPFKTISNVFKMLEYCKRYGHFLKALDGLPLLVLGDETLKKFSKKDKTFYSTYGRHIIPEKPFLFLHRKLLPIFEDNDSFELTGVFKRFTSKDLASLLTHVKGMEHSYGNPYEEWNPEDQNEPRKFWFFHVWQYLFDEAEALFGKELKIENEEHRQQLRNLLEPLYGWNILPVVQKLQGRGLFLVPLEEAITVADLNLGGTTTLQVRTFLRKVGIPEPDFDILHLYKKGNKTVSRTGSERFIQLIIGSIATPDRLLMALKRMLKVRGEEKLGKLEMAEATSVLRYMTEHLAVIQAAPDNIETLQKLPFYYTVTGKLVSVYKKNVYILPQDIPDDEMDVWLKRSFFVFLKDEKEFQELYEYIGCKKMPVTEIYKTDIFRHFFRLSHQAQMIHLGCLVRNLDRLEFEEPIYLRPSSDNFIGRIVSHIINICKHLQSAMENEANSSTDPFQDLFECIYKYLDQQELPKIQKSRLRGIPMVLVDEGNMLVSSKQIAFEPEDWADIPPYLFKIPPFLKEYKGLFEKLGATTVFTPEQYSFVLKSLHSDSIGGVLEQNKIDMAKSAIYGFFYSADRLGKESFENVDSVYLLSDSYKLILSRELVWKDDPSLKGRHVDKPFMLSLSECNHVPNERQMITDMPSELKPNALSTLVEELRTEREYLQENIDELTGCFKSWELESE